MVRLVLGLLLLAWSANSMRRGLWRSGENPISLEEYIGKALGAYRRTPGTAGTIRRPDRLLAAQLHERGVPLMAVENVLVLAEEEGFEPPNEFPR